MKENKSKKGLASRVGAIVILVIAAFAFIYVPGMTQSVAGSIVYGKYDGKKIIVQELNKDSFKGIDIALFSAGGSVSLEYCPIAAAAGAVVIDNSSAWRTDPTLPLVVPEVNPQDIRNYGIISNPNCSTIQSIVPIKALEKYDV